MTSWKTSHGPEKSIITAPSERRKATGMLPWAGGVSEFPLSFPPVPPGGPVVSRELADRHALAQHRAVIHCEVECIATFFFRTNQKRVSGLLVVLRLIRPIRLFILSTTVTRQLLAAITIIIKFLPHHLQLDTPDS